MDFVGTGTRVSPGGVAAAARDIGCDEAAVRAVLQVEAAGHGFDAEGRPKCLFEPHKFYAFLGAGPKRDSAVAQGLAYPKWRPGNYPHSSDGVYEQLGRAMAIDEACALRATSWGLSQILGDYYDEAGFSTVQEFVQANMEGEDRQLAIMADLTQHWGLDDELRRHDWAGFARGWNGPGYKANRYDEKLAADYAKAPPEQRGEPAKTTFPGVAQLGMEGPVVSDVQEKLSAAGYRVGADGDFGLETKKAVMAFQLANGLKPDGRVGPKTLAALAAARPHKVEEERADATAADLKAQGSTIVKNGDGVTKLATVGAAGVGVAKSGVLQQAQSLMSAVGEKTQAVNQVAGKANDVASQATSALESAKGAAGHAGRAVGLFGDLMQLVDRFWWVAVVVVLIVIAAKGSDIVKARVRDHQTGKTL